MCRANILCNMHTSLSVNCCLYNGMVTDCVRVQVIEGPVATCGLK